MNSERKRPYAKISKITLYVMMAILVLMTIILLVFILLRKLISVLVHFLFDSDFIGNGIDTIDEFTFNIISSLFGVKNGVHTTHWANSIDNLTSNNAGHWLFLVFLLFVVVLIFYWFTLIMRHHNGEMAPFFNDLESIRLKQKVIKETGSKVKNKSDEKDHKINKVEKLARKNIRKKTKVQIYTMHDEGQIKPVKTYKITIKVPKGKDVKNKVDSKIKDLHISLSEQTGGVSFDQEKKSTDKRYHVFEGSQEVERKVARSLKKEHTSKENDATTKSDDIDIENEGNYPLSLIGDRSTDIERDRAKAQTYADELVERISTYFSTYDMPSEFKYNNVGNSSIEYVYSKRFSKQTKAENQIAKDLSDELKSSGVKVTSRAGTLKVTVPLPKDYRVAIDERDLIRNSLKNASDNTEAVFGIGVDNSRIHYPLSKAPHMLVAGTTGSGKSVGLNYILASLMWHNTPDEVKFGIVDPKMTEFTDYENSPYLITNPITTVADGDGSIFLNYIVHLQEERYKMFEKAKKRKITAYNDWARKNGKPTLPYLVIIVDEFSDMKDVDKDIEKPIRRLGQKARAAGIILIIATQRPSVDVITGTIKANLPMKVAFSVDSVVNSRVILGEDGAEELKGQGDMYIKLNGANELIRAQGGFLKDEEITAITNYVKEHNEKPVYEDYKAVMARLEGEDEEGNEQFNAVSSLQQTRTDQQKEVSKTSSTSNRRKSVDEMTQSELSTLEKAKQKAKQRKAERQAKQQKTNVSESNKKEPKKVSLDIMDYLDQENQSESTESQESQISSEDKNNKSNVSTEDILGL